MHRIVQQKEQSLEQMLMDHYNSMDIDAGKPVGTMWRIVQRYHRLRAKNTKEASA